MVSSFDLRVGERLGCVDVYVCVYVWMCVCMRVRVCTCVCVDMCGYVYMSAWVCAYTTRTLPGGYVCMYMSSPNPTAVAVLQVYVKVYEDMSATRPVTTQTLLVRGSACMCVHVCVCAACVRMYI